MKREITKAEMKASASVDRGAGVQGGIAFKNFYKVECFDKEGNLKWEDEFTNLVTNAGLDDNLDKYFIAQSPQHAPDFYVGLVDGTTSPEPSYAAGDTMSSHTGWTEEQSYTEGTREALTLSAVSGQSTDNSSNKASFSINADSQIIAGCFICTDSTKGGTSGVLYSVGAFTGGNKSADDGDTLNVTVTLTAAAA